MNIRFPKLPSLPRRSKSTGQTTAVYLGETTDLDLLTGDEIGIVLGELVIMKLDDPPQEGSGNIAYVPQYYRECRRTDLSLAALRHPTTRIFSSIHPLLAQHIEGNPNGTRFILAADAMSALAARRKRSDTLLICSGYEARDQTYFDTYIYRFGQLIQITEAILIPATNPRYLAEVKAQLDDILSEYPDAHILWAEPLSPIRLEGYTLENIGSEIYHGKFPQLTHDGQTTPPSPWIPAIVTSIVIAMCVAFGAFDIATLDSKRDVYDALTQQTPGSTSTTPLEILQSRANWQRETDNITIESILMPANRLLSAVAMNPDWRLTSLSLATQRSSEIATPPVPPSNETAPLSVTLTAPLQTDTQSTEQAQPIVAALNQQTGAKLIVRQQGISTTAEAGRIRVTIDTDTANK